MKTHLDLGKLRVEGGYFLLRPQQRPKPFAEDLRSVADPLRFCFTYQDSRRSIEEELLRLIRDARQKLFITSFRIGDEKVFRALVDAAQRLRGGIYIITALDDRSLAEGLEEMDEAPKDGIASLKKSFHEMTRAGIYVRGHSSCHAKFAVADDRVALVCSANFESRAFNETGECGVVVETPGEVVRLARLFTRLWHAGCDWEMAPGPASLVQQRQPGPSPCSVPQLSADQNGVIWTDHAETLILNHLHDIISRAKRELLLATFSLTGMGGHPELLLAPLERIIQKQKLEVKLLVRGRNNVRGHRLDAQRLNELGVSVFADHLNHAKGAIADRASGILFSANFDAAHGLTTGVETGVRLDGSPALADAANYFDHAIQNASLEFITQPTLQEMNERLACRWRSSWPFPRALRVCGTDATWNRFVGEAKEGPVLYEQAADSTAVLYVGRSSWKLTLSADASCDLSAQGATKPATELLEAWLGSKSLPRARRGFCPATLECDKAT